MGLPRASGTFLHVISFLRFDIWGIQVWYFVGIGEGGGDFVLAVHESPPRAWEEGTFAIWVTGSVLFGVLFLWLLCYAIAQLYTHLVFVLPMRNRSAGARQRLKRIRMANGESACSHLTPDFRQLMQMLTIASLVMRVLWLVDPVGVFGLFPVVLEHLLLRLPQVFLLVMALLVVLLWRRLASSASRAEHIKSVMMVGRYKYVLGFLVGLLLLATIASLLGAVGVGSEAIRWVIRVVFFVYVLSTLVSGCLFARQFQLAISHSKVSSSSSTKRTLPPSAPLSPPPRLHAPPQPRQLQGAALSPHSSSIQPHQSQQHPPQLQTRASGLYASFVSMRTLLFDPPDSPLSPPFRSTPAPPDAPPPISPSRRASSTSALELATKPQDSPPSTPPSTTPRPPASPLSIRSIRSAKSMRSPSTSPSSSAPSSPSPPSDLATVGEKMWRAVLCGWVIGGMWGIGFVIALALQPLPPGLYIGYVFYLRCVELAAFGLALSQVISGSNATPLTGLDWLDFVFCCWWPCLSHQKEAWRKRSEEKMGGGSGGKSSSFKKRTMKHRSGGGGSGRNHSAKKLGTVPQQRRSLFRTENPAAGASVSPPTTVAEGSERRESDRSEGDGGRRTSLSPNPLHEREKRRRGSSAGSAHSIARRDSASGMAAARHSLAKELERRKKMMKKHSQKSQSSKRSLGAASVKSVRSVRGLSVDSVATTGDEEEGRGGW